MPASQKGTGNLFMATVVIQALVVPQMLASVSATSTGFSTA